jgi:hypothetical protein
MAQIRRVALVVVIVLALAVIAVARAAPTQVPETTNLKAQPGTFCVHRAQGCSNPGTKITFQISTAAKVNADIRPRSSNLASYVEFHRKSFPAGKNSFRLADTRLSPGRWTLKLQAINHVGAGTTAILTVHVVKP